MKIDEHGGREIEKVLSIASLFQLPHLPFKEASVGPILKHRLSAGSVIKGAWSKGWNTRWRGVNFREEDKIRLHPLS